MRILGIDPGSRITGYGMIDEHSQGSRYVTSGCIRAQAETFPLRLKQIYDGIHQIVQEYAPDQVAIEQVFMHRNADSALKLGHARGAAICAALSNERAIHEYATRSIKQTVVGKGSADKNQVQHMVKILLNLTGELQIDASDALATALCHAHHLQAEQRLQQLANV